MEISLDNLEKSSAAGYGALNNERVHALDTHAVNVDDTGKLKYKPFSLEHAPKGFGYFVILLLVSGALKNSIQSAVQRIPGFDDACVPYFHKPVFMTFVIYLGMTCAAFSTDLWLKDHYRLMARDDYATTFGWLFLIAIGGVVANIAESLASQLLDGSLCEGLTHSGYAILIAILAKYYRGHILHWNHYVGILIGTICTALFTLSNSLHTENEKLFWVVFEASVIAPVFMAMKFLASEKLSHDHGVSGYYQLVVSGLLGTIICIVLLPIAESLRGSDCNDSWESSLDTFQKVGGYVSETPVVVSLYICLFLLSFTKTSRDYSAFVVIMMGSSTDEAIWEYARSPCTWVINMIIYYTGGEEYHIGEAYSSVALLLFSGGCFGTWLFYRFPYSRKEASNSAKLNASMSQRFK